MAKVFLDTNFFIDITIRNKEKAKSLDGHKLFLSPLSYHIVYYAYHLKVPHQEINNSLLDLEIVDLNEKILGKAMIGPTKDLEDNIQLHSAAEAECDYFLTNDRRLLKMKFFGKTEISSSLSL